MITPQQIEQLGVHPALGSMGSGWGIEQNPHELATFLNALPPIKRVLEIGTGYRAGFARFMAQVMGWRVVTVDINNYGHSIEGVEFMVIGNHRPELHETVDLVFIDGDHTYNSVWADYEHYRRYASKVIAFHDIAGLRNCDGAAKFWRNIAY